MEKQITIHLPGSEQFNDIAIKPGTTAGDILNQLDLEGYELRRPNSNDPDDVFGRDEDVYDAVAEGQKVQAGPIAEVGNSQEV